MFEPGLHVNRARIAKLGGAIVLCVASAALMYFVSRPRPKSSEFTRPASPWGSGKEHDATLLSATFVPADDSRAVRGSLTEAIMDPTAGNTPLDASKSESLIGTIESYVAAFASSDPEDYLRIVDAERSRWIPPTDPAWMPIDFAIDYLEKRPTDRTNPHAELRVLLQNYICKDGMRRTMIGSGSTGVRLLVASAKTAGPLEFSLLFDRFGETEHKYWTGGGRHSIRLREPRTSPGDIIASTHEIVYAQSAVLFRTESGTPGVWHATWYWSPSDERWLNHTSAVESFHGLGMFY